MDRDRLILVAVVPDDTLDQYVERSAQKDIVSWVLDNMELYVKCDVSDEDWDIVGKAQSLVNFTVCQLHAEMDMGVVDEGQHMTRSFRHGDDLGTGVEDGFNVLVMVD